MSEDPAAKSAPAAAPEEPVSIEKPPPGEILARFKTKRSLDERIQTLLPALPHRKISDAKDYVRLHPDDAYWSDEYCFVMVPVPGIKGLRAAPARFRLGGGASPGSLQDSAWRWRRSRTISFSCPGPQPEPRQRMESLEPGGVRTPPRTSWKGHQQETEGSEGYHIKPTESELRGEGDPFPEPNWPTESLDEIVAKTFDGRMILDREVRLGGAWSACRQKLS